MALNPALSPWKTEYTVNHAGAGETAVSIEYENTDTPPAITSVTGGTYVSYGSGKLTWQNVSGSGANFKIGWQGGPTYTIHLTNTAT